MFSMLHIFKSLIAFILPSMYQVLITSSSASLFYNIRIGTSCNFEVQYSFKLGLGIIFRLISGALWVLGLAMKMTN